MKTKFNFEEMCFPNEKRFNFSFDSHVKYYDENDDDIFNIPSSNHFLFNPPIAQGSNGGKSVSGDFSVESSCSLCSVGKANCACISCHEHPLLCQQCESDHILSMLTRGHRILPLRLKDYSQIHEDNGFIHCDHVPPTPSSLNVVCNTCCMVLCCDCAYGGHLEHDIFFELVESPQISSNFISAINSNIRDSYQHLSSIHALHEKTEDYYDVVVNDIAQKHKEIDRDFNSIISTLTEMQKVAHLELDSNGSKLLQPLETKLKDLSNLIAISEQEMQNINHILQSGVNIYDSVQSSHNLLQRLSKAQENLGSNCEMSPKFALGLSKENITTWKFGMNLMNMLNSLNNGSSSNTSGSVVNNTGVVGSTLSGNGRVGGSALPRLQSMPQSTLLSKMSFSMKPTFSHSSTLSLNLPTENEPLSAKSSISSMSSILTAPSPLATTASYNSLTRENSNLSTGMLSINTEAPSYPTDHPNSPLSPSNHPFVRGPGIIGDGKGATPGQFQNPAGIAVYVPSRDDSPDPMMVFVADHNNHRIQVFDALTGGFLRSVGFGKGSGPGQLQNPAGIAMYTPTASDKATLIYVADYNNHRIQIFNAMSGAILQTIGGGKGTRPGQLQHPYGVALYCPPNDEGQRLLFVSEYDNHRVQVFDAISGAYIRSFGGRGNAMHNLQCPAGVSLYLQPDGKIVLYVADSANHRIQVYNYSTGSYLGSIGGGRGSSLGQLKNPIGCTTFISPYGEAFLVVAEYDNHRVQVFNAVTGRPIKVIGMGQGSNLGQMRGPWNVALAPCFLPFSQLSDHQLMFLSEFGNNNRVQVFLVQFN